MVNNPENVKVGLFDQLMYINLIRANNQAFLQMLRSLKEEKRFPGLNLCPAKRGIYVEHLPGKRIHAGPVSSDLTDLHVETTDLARGEFEQKGVVNFTNFYRLHSVCLGRLCPYRACELRKGVTVDMVQVNYHLGNGIVGRIYHLFNQKRKKEGVS
jgi:hypothetical protein